MVKRQILLCLAALVVGGCGMAGAPDQAASSEATVSSLSESSISAACDDADSLAVETLGGDTLVRDFQAGSCGWVDAGRRPIRSVTLFAFSGSPEAIEEVNARDLPLPSGTVRVDVTCNEVGYQLIIPSDGAQADVAERLSQAVC